MKKIRVLVIIVLILSIVGILAFYFGKSKDKYYKNEILKADVSSSTPQLINANYHTDSFIVADYVLNSSSDDMTNAIKNALDTCGKNGGGTVWLKQGVYNVSSSITIPSACTLMGDWQDPDNYQGTLDYGTKIVVDVKNFKSDNNDLSATGLFKLKPGSGVCGLTIYYKNQSITNPVAQPWSFIYVSNESDMSLLNTIKNITLINSYRGIGQSMYNSSHATLGIENVKGTVLFEGVLLRRSGDVGTINGLTLKPKYWAQANLKAFNDNVKNNTESDISNKIKAIGGRGLAIAKVDSSQLVNIEISGYEYGVLIPSNNNPSNRNMEDKFDWVYIYNMKILDCKYGIYVQSGSVADLGGGTAAQLMTYVISNSSISGNNYAIYNDCDEVNIRNSGYGYTGTFRGALRLNDVEIKGRIGGKGRTMYYDVASNRYKDITNDADYTGKINNTNKFSNLNLYHKYKNNGNNFMYLNNGSSVDQINNALASISAKGGGVVYLRPGRYDIDKSIVVPKNVELRGSSTSRVHFFNMGTVLDVKNNGKYFRAIIISGDNAGITGINIMYKAMIDALEFNNTYANGDYAVVAENVKNVYVRDVTIAGATFGIYFNKCNNFAAKNILTSVSHNAIRMDNSKNGLVMNTLNNGWLLDWNKLYASNKGINVLNVITLKTLKYIYMVNSSDIELQNCFGFRTNTTVYAENSNFYGVNVGHDDSLMGDTMYLVNNNSSGVMVNVIRYSKCAIINNISGNNVGIYNVAASFNNDEADVKNNLFKISKRYYDAKLDVSSNSISLSNSDSTINYEYDGDGKLSCISSNENIVKCSIDFSKKTIMVNPVNNGSATITLKASSGKNYKDISKIISANVQFNNKFNVTGDVNGDGNVNSKDYILIRKHILGEKLIGNELKMADVNKDNYVNTADYIIIRKKILGI